jgi:mannitol/fructose-specific phosphotransferase system IIA component (Ntr-type)
MKITDFLAPSDVACNLRAADKTALLRELAGRAAAALGLPAEAIAAELEKREELGSTGPSRAGCGSPRYCRNCARPPTPPISIAPSQRDV